MLAVEKLIRAQGETDQPGAMFRALDVALAEEPGHILFTVLVHHAEARESERLYTNRPEAYPVGGRKPVTDHPWMRQVMQSGQPYIGRNRTDIQYVFFDYELIWSLGCESVLNMPVRWRGTTLGTLNLLHRSGHYTEAHLPQVQLMAALAVPAFLVLTRY